MSAPTHPYRRHRVLRTLERLWGRLEALVERLSTGRYNPFYQTGQTAILLLVVLGVTGLWLTIFYRPGAERAFTSVEGLSANWFGSLMRTVHRYASGALIIVTLLHALKSLVRDQFRGARWLPWVSGWLLLGLFWVIGVMGYWLVWDQTAQWISEWAMRFGRGASVISFFEPTLAGKTFMFFVIVLFLHIFLSVIIIGWVLVHVIRLSRVRLFTPRWATVAAVASLVVVALLRPARSNLPADMSRLVGDVRMDHWYLGFLPAVDRLGLATVLVLGIGLFVVGLAAPWWLRGPREAAATVDPDRCHGDGRCHRACPYSAIEMVPREGPYERLSHVHADLCVGCGLCVAVCPTGAIDLPHMPAEELRKATVAALAEAGDETLLVYACSRHDALGSLPSAEDLGRPVVCTVLECSGMANVRWIREALEGGAGAVAVVSCPEPDCRFEEGSVQVAQRLDRGWLRDREEVGRLEVHPADRSLLRRLLARFPERSRAAPRWAPLAGGAVLALLVAVTLVGFRTSTPLYPADAAIRVAFVHRGAFQRTEGAGVQGTFDEKVDVGEVLGSTRHAVALRIVVDGVTAMERSFAPAGLRNDGPSSAVETVWVDPGIHDVEVWMDDDGGGWREVFSGRIDVADRTVPTLLWSEDLGRFRVTGVD